MPMVEPSSGLKKSPKAGTKKKEVALSGEVGQGGGAGEPAGRTAHQPE